MINPKNLDRFKTLCCIINRVQVNLDMTDSMGSGKLVRHMQNLSYTYDEYLKCIGLGPSISSVICKNLSYSGPSYPSSPVYSNFFMVSVSLNLTLNSNEGEGHLQGSPSNQCLDIFLVNLQGFVKMLHSFHVVTFLELRNSLCNAEQKNKTKNVHVKNM